MLRCLLGSSYARSARTTDRGFWIRARTSRWFRFVECLGISSFGYLHIYCYSSADNYAVRGTRGSSRLLKDGLDGGMDEIIVISSSILNPVVEGSM